MNPMEHVAKLGTNERGNKLFVSIYEKNIQIFADSQTATITVAIIEDAKAGRKLVDTLRVRMSDAYLANYPELSADVTSDADGTSREKIIAAATDMVKAAYKLHDGVFPVKELVGDVPS
jgi:hypothetical protein